MSDIAIRVENLGKRFELGELGTMRDFVRKARRLGRSLARPTRNGHDTARPWEHETDPTAFWALKGIDFEVKEGEVLGIIGRNGAGKSTLLKILSRITAPTCGRIDVYGRIAALLEVGTGFHQELTGRENIYLNGSILGMTRREIDRKLDEIVDFAGVEKFIDTPVKRYSSGMKVRLGFAVAAHLEPEILIVDEVLAVGDAEFQKKCLGKMKDVATCGRTVLFVSHNLTLVQALCPSALLLRDGALIDSGSTEQVVATYSALSSPVSASSFDRPRWAKPCIKEVRLLSSEGAPLATAKIGETVVLAVEFASCPDHPAFRVPALGVTLRDSAGGSVGGVNMRMTGSAVRHDSDGGVIRCELRSLMLAPDLYSIDVWLADGTVDVDAVRDAATLEVGASDIYGSGQAPTRRYGPVVFEADWEIQGHHEPITVAAVH